jgi:ABC-2 type transport system permease protein
MKKYLQIFKTSWEDGFVYRLNFVMWRLRTIFWLLASYFFWLAVYQNRTQIGSYTQKAMLTYILGTFLLSELIQRNISVSIGEEISSGDLTNYLVKPINYFYYWIVRDWADKLLNLFFGIVELIILVFIFKPSLAFNLEAKTLAMLFLSLPLAVLLSFWLDLLISLLSFWYPEHGGWPQRFVSSILFTFLMGTYFPLDILPFHLGKILSLLPTGFLIYFPLQIYLGRVNSLDWLINFLVMLFWTFVLYKLNQKIWLAGLKKYAAQGR